MSNKPFPPDTTCCINLREGLRRVFRLCVVRSAVAEECPRRPFGIIVPSVWGLGKRGVLVLRDGCSKALV